MMAKRYVRKVLQILLVVGLLTIGAMGNAAGSSSLAVQLPRSAMGRLEWQIQSRTLSTCTAMLIGTDAILTNAHCLVLNLPTDEGKFIDLFIEPGVYPELIGANAVLGLKLVFKPSTALDNAEIVTYEAGWTEDYNSPNDDWAVLKLEQPLGENYGFWSWRDLDFVNTETLNKISTQINLLEDIDYFLTAVWEDLGEPTTMVPNASGGPGHVSFTDILQAIGN
ncbi:MAG: trypsin-like serine protease [Cyanobacteria bacterium P01_F01_bin.116]